MSSLETLELTLADLPRDVDEDTYLRVARAQCQRIMSSPEFLEEERAAIESGHRPPAPLDLSKVKSENAWHSLMQLCTPEQRIQFFLLREKRRMEFADGVWAVDGYAAENLVVHGEKRPVAGAVLRKIPSEGTLSGPERAATGLTPEDAGAHLPAATSEAERPVVPALRADDLLSEARVLLEAERELAEERDAPPVTVRDVVRTVAPDWCYRGRNTNVSWLSTGRIRNQYNFCLGAKCPHCVGWWLEGNVIKRALEAWEDTGATEIHRTVLSEREWTNSKRAKRIRSEYKDAYLLVKRADGDSVVYTPGAAEYSDPVSSDQLAAVILDDLLAAAAATGGKNRFRAPASRKKREEREADVQAEEIPKLEREKLVIPLHRMSLEEAAQTVDEVAGEALSWAESRPGRKAKIWRQLQVDGASRDVVVGARQRFMQLDAEEQALRQAKREGAELLAALGVTD